MVHGDQTPHSGQLEKQGSPLEPWFCPVPAIGLPSLIRKGRYDTFVSPCLAISASSWKSYPPCRRGRVWRNAGWSYMEVSIVIGVPLVRIHFRLGFSMKWTIQLLGYHFLLKPPYTLRLMGEPVPLLSTCHARSMEEKDQVRNWDTCLHHPLWKGPKKPCYGFIMI